MSYMVYLLNGVDGNTLAQGIYANNKMLKFGVGGKFLGEFPLSYKYSRLREIDIVSIINVENKLEVGYNIGKQFSKYPIYAEVYDIVKWCNTHPSLVFMGKRDELFQDSKGSIGYSQYFFGFTKGCLDEKQLQEVMKVNG